MPLPLITWVGKLNYKSKDIQRFFDENIRFGLEEIASQYHEVVADGKRYGVKMPNLLALGPYFEPNSSAVHEPSTSRPVQAHAGAH